MGAETVTVPVVVVEAIVLFPLCCSCCFCCSLCICKELAYHTWNASASFQSAFAVNEGDIPWAVSLGEAAAGLGTVGIVERMRLPDQVFSVESEQLVQLSTKAPCPGWRLWNSVCFKEATSSRPYAFTASGVYSLP